MRFIAVLLLSLITSSAIADSVMALRSWGNVTTPPNRILSIIAEITTAKDGIVISGFANDGSSPVKSVAIQGNGNTLATCLGQSCNYLWPKTSMRVGSNSIAILMTNTTGAQFITTATIGQP